MERVYEESKHQIPILSKKTGRGIKKNAMSNQPTLINITPLHIGAINYWKRKLSPVPEIRLDGKEGPTRHESASRTIP
jgi:hypothetical protein